MSARRILAAAPLLALLGAAPADRHGKAPLTLDQRLTGFTPGKATDCLMNSYARDATTEGYGKTVLYVVNRRLIFRNDTTGGCEGKADGDVLVTVSNEGQLCRGDIARTIDPVAHFTTGSCALGGFVPYRR